MSRALPPLHALRAFEAAGRLGQFIRAAEELRVSATAISHHVRRLEEDLGVQLFVRKTRKVELTESGERLLSACTAALDSIDEAVLALRAGSKRRAITLALGPMFAARWLTPRLSRLWSAFPELDVRLCHTPGSQLGDSFDFDVLIAWGDGHWPGMEVTPLLRVSSVPVASPALIERLGAPEEAGELLRWPLLHQRDESGWREWFEANGVGTAPTEGAVIEDANVVLQAAIDGQGVALGFFPFVEPELQSGRLVKLSDRPMKGSRAYHLVRRKHPRRDATVDGLSRWLLAEAAATPGNGS